MPEANGVTPIDEAHTTKNLKGMKLLLSANLDNTEEHTKLLELFIRQNHADSIAMLLGALTDVSCQYALGETPLSLAAGLRG